MYIINKNPNKVKSVKKDNLTTLDFEVSVGVIFNPP